MAILLYTVAVVVSNVFNGNYGSPTVMKEIVKKRLQKRMMESTGK
jgi:hypothetical protein